MSDQQLSPSERNPRYLHHTCHGTDILSLDEVGMFENKWNIGAFKFCFSSDFKKRLSVIVHQALKSTHFSGDY